MLGVGQVKPRLTGVTLLCADTTHKAHLAARAIAKSMEQADFEQVKLLTNNSQLPHAVKIPEIKGLEAYSKFCIRDMHKYVDTPHALIVQFDGYALNGEAWTDEFLKFDYGGAPFQPSNTIGNGGFGIRSKRIMEACSKLPTGSDHPEDAAISIRFRSELEAQGLKFMPVELARKLSFEGRSWDSKEWRGVQNKWAGSFGFHSFLSAGIPDPPVIAVHAGDAGDIIYSMPVLKALGGGMLFLTPDNKFPYPLDTRWTRTGGDAEFVDNLAPLLEAQPYVWSCKYTHGHPASCTHDLNRFRLPWRNRTAKDFQSILSLHCEAFNVPIPTEPWLTVPDPICVPGRPIVVSRTARYHNDKFDWYKLVQKWHSKMVFVGTEQEASVFQGLSCPHKVPHFKTSNAMELAQVIAGSEMFIGNQSLALAIAHGLFKKVVIEEWPLNPNTRMDRPGVYLGVPENWL